MNDKDEIWEKMSLMEHIRIFTRGIKLCMSYSKRFFIYRILSIAVYNFLPYIPIYLSALLIDSLVYGDDLRTIVIYAALTVGLSFLFNALGSYLDSISSKARSEFWRGEHWNYSRKAMEMSYEQIESRDTTVLCERIRKESQTGNNVGMLISCMEGLTGSITKVVSSLTMSMSVFLLDNVSAVMKLALIAGVAVNIVYSFWSTSKIFKASEAFWFKCVDSNIMVERYDDYISDYASGKDIRIYNMKDWLVSVYDNYLNILNKLDIDRTLQQILYTLPQNILDEALKCCAYIILITAAIGGSLSVGSIAKYVSCLMLLIEGIKSTISNTQSVMNNNHYLKRYFSYFDIPNDMYKGTLTVEKRDDGEYFIEFRDVSFKYSNSADYALRHVNLKFRIGEKLAVVGMNGSGKTTFIKLLCRLYDPTEGEILLNGVNIQKYDYDEYMSLFSVVFQDFRLFAFTLGQNVACSNEYDSERVRECLIKAGLDKRLAELDEHDGLDTYLWKNMSDKGIEISGGEGQKIALARALYKDSPFVVLDEPTSALDPVSEFEIYSKFNSITGGKTAVYISHRLASCRFCDKIAVFDEGKIIETGSHDSLYSNESGKYRELWDAQAKYYV